MLRVGLEGFWVVASCYCCPSSSFSATFFFLRNQMRILAFSTGDSRTGRTRSHFFFSLQGLNEESSPSFSQRESEKQGAHSYRLFWLCGHDSARDLLLVQLLGLTAGKASLGPPIQPPAAGGCISRLPAAFC